MFALAASFLALLTTVSVTGAFLAFLSCFQSSQICWSTSEGQATPVALFSTWLLVYG